MIFLNLEGEGSQWNMEDQQENWLIYSSNKFAAAMNLRRFQVVIIQTVNCGCLDKICFVLLIHPVLNWVVKGLDKYLVYFG